MSIENCSVSRDYLPAMNKIKRKYATLQKQRSAIDEKLSKLEKEAENLVIKDCGFAIGDWVQWVRNKNTKKGKVVGIAYTYYNSVKLTVNIYRMRNGKQIGRAILRVDDDNMMIEICDNPQLTKDGTLFTVL